MAMKSFLLILVFDVFFSAAPVQSQTVSPSGAKSFTPCTVADGQPACASDAPNTTIALDHSNLNTALCPDVLCAWQCRIDPQCLEFNAHSSTWICDLYYNQPMVYQQMEGCRHFQDKNSVYCQNADSNPCLNGGSCSPICNDYTCACSPGYTGKNCETNINECLSDPCQNGGTCIDQVNGYTCQCVCSAAPCYAGLLCQNTFNLVDTTFSSITTTVSCIPGYSLISCSRNNGITGGSNYDYHRSIVPMNSTMCQCRDKFTSVCIAWCYSGSMSHFQIVKQPPGSTYLTGTVQVTCPTGTNVIGCNPNSNPNGATDKYQQCYPSSNTTCTCSDTGGTQCIATCASNVKNYEIKAVNFGSGVFVTTVTCSPSSSVLGCGMQPNTVGVSGNEKWRTAYVNQDNACQCYDYFGTTCYAICGQLQ